MHHITGAVLSAQKNQPKLGGIAFDLLDQIVTSASYISIQLALLALFAMTLPFNSKM